MAATVHHSNSKLKPVSSFQSKLHEAGIVEVAATCKNIINWDNGDTTRIDNEVIMQDASSPASHQRTNKSVNTKTTISSSGSRRNGSPDSVHNPDDDDAEEEELPYDSGSSSPPDSDTSMSETLINDDNESSIPPHRRDLLDALHDITATYSNTIFSSADRAVDLLVQYEKAGLNLITQLETCRHEEAAAAEAALEEKRLVLSRELGRIERVLEEEGEMANVIGVEIEKGKSEIDEARMELERGVMALEGLC
jgi:hypothetical protein